MLTIINQFHSFIFPTRKIQKPPKSPSLSRSRLPNLHLGLNSQKWSLSCKASFLGFTRTAEIWNSRACMIGLIGTFIVELIINKGILQVIGVDIGKGLDLPLWAVIPNITQIHLRLGLICTSPDFYYAVTPLQLCCTVYCILLTVWQQLMNPVKFLLVFCIWILKILLW